jgi:hypothetical protein
MLAWEGQPDAAEEYFLEGTEPKERAFPPDLLTPEAFLMEEGFEEEQPDPGAPAEPAPAAEGTSGEPASPPASG